MDIELLDKTELVYSVLCPNYSLLGLNFFIEEQIRVNIP